MDEKRIVHGHARMKEVAARVGVSEATVSRVLNQNANISSRTRDRVLVAANELGYVRSFSASALASGRTRNIGVLVPAVNRWYFASLLEGITHALRAEGYDLTLYNSAGGKHHESLLKDFLLRQRSDAIIVVACRLNHDEIDGLLAIGKPAIGVGGPFPGLSTISIDDREVARQATEHLINLGHQHVAHIGGRDDHGPTFNMAQLRLDGYRQALRTNGLPLHPPWMTESDFTVAGGYRAAKRLLRDPTDRPTAIFSSSDEMAAGAMLAARELGLAIPDDLSIISIDGHELAQTFGITTYSQAPQEQGRRACLRLLSILKDPQLNPPFDEQFEAKLVTRSSTATPNARANHMEAAGTVR